MSDPHTLDIEDLFTEIDTIDPDALPENREERTKIKFDMPKTVILRDASRRLMTSENGPYWMITGYAFVRDDHGIEVTEIGPAVIFSSLKVLNERLESANCDTHTLWVIKYHGKKRTADGKRTFKNFSVMVRD